VRRLGRSGTGKTTCGLYRIYSQWLASRLQQRMGEAPTHTSIVFVTASATLQAQVQRAFRHMQASEQLPCPTL
jgi:hypothetical protein